jgi:hypothetical protein
MCQDDAWRLHSSTVYQLNRADSMSDNINSGLVYRARDFNRSVPWLDYGLLKLTRCYDPSSKRVLERFGLVLELGDCPKMPSGINAFMMTNKPVVASAAERLAMLKKRAMKQENLEKGLLK